MRGLWVLGALAGMSFAGCGSGPSAAEQREVRAVVLSWFNALSDGEALRAQGMMASDCTNFDLAGTFLLADIADGVRILSVDVDSIDGDEASTTSKLTADFGYTRPPFPVDLLREDGEWKVSCLSWQ